MKNSGTAFAYIPVRAISNERVFVNPFGKYRRLDVCLRWGVRLCKPQRNTFCAVLSVIADAFHAKPGCSGAYIHHTRRSATTRSATNLLPGFQQIICVEASCVRCRLNETTIAPVFNRGFGLTSLTGTRLFALCPFSSFRCAHARLVLMVARPACDIYDMDLLTAALNSLWPSFPEAGIQCGNWAPPARSDDI